MRQVFPFISRAKFEQLGRGGGVNVEYTYLVKTEAIGKSKSPDSPYLLANEWIAGNIAQFLRLPVPPFAFVRKKSADTAMFISYNFEGDTTPDDAIPGALYEHHADLCAGITVFDCLVANCDRHASNLKVDRPAKPRVCHLIDHERALFYIEEGKGIERLQSREDRLGVTDADTSRDEWHCLIDQLDSLSLIQKWVKRIEELPDWFIDEVCEEVPRRALKRREINAVKAFLKKRKTILGRLILNHRDRFVSIPPADWQVLFV